MTTPQTLPNAPLEAFFTPAQIPDAAEFVRLRAQIYAADINDATRVQYLRELTDNTMTSARVSLAEAAREQVIVTEPEGAPDPRKRLELAQRTSQVVIGVLVDPDSWDVTGVVEHTQIKTSDGHVRGQQNAMALVPYGHKSTWGSFRLSSR
jgi:hypothetical protein